MAPPKPTELQELQKRVDEAESLLVGESRRLHRVNKEIERKDEKIAELERLLEDERGRTSLETGLVKDEARAENETHLHTISVSLWGHPISMYI